MSRRGFIQHSLAGATAAAPLLIPHHALAQGNRPGANDRVGVALIGCGRRGQSYIDPGLPPRTQIVAACDVHRGRAELLARKVNITDKDVVQDYRRVLDRQDVEAVMIATPEHWHALIAIAACQAGKHVYVEKPMTLCVVEGRRMVETERSLFGSKRSG
jgi:predicted dehydrogenase